jgi:hypothetical protein
MNPDATYAMPAVRINPRNQDTTPVELRIQSERACSVAQGKCSYLAPTLG